MPSTTDDIVRFAESQFTLPPALGPTSNITPTTAVEILTRSSFRRTSLDAASLSDVRAEVESQMSSGEPIKLCVPFGGYKSWRVSTAPLPDWAEVFALNHLCKYIFALAAYPGGATLEFSYCSNVIGRMSNMPERYSAEYITRFGHLIDDFNLLLPAHIRLGLVDIATLYSPEELEAELVANYERNQQRWLELLPEAEREKKVRSARRNLMADGIVDLTRAQGDEWESLCINAAMWCDAVDSLSRRRRFNKLTERIQLVYVRGPKPSIHIGSCEMSSSHFWVGTGVAQQLSASRVCQRIVSQAEMDDLARAGLLLSVSLERPHWLSTLERISSVTPEGRPGMLSNPSSR